MCKTHEFTVRYLFDCEACGEPVSSDDTGFDGENNWCPECVNEFNTETALELVGRWLAEKPAGLLDETDEPVWRLKK